MNLFTTETKFDGTNWSEFGEVITIATLDSSGSFNFIPATSDNCYKFIIALNKYISKTKKPLYSYGSLEYFLRRIRNKGLETNKNIKEFKSGVTDIALNHIDILYSIYKNFGYLISMESIISGMGISSRGLISPSLIPVYFEQKIDTVKEHSRIKLEIMKEIIEYINSSGTIKWKTSSGKINEKPIKLCSVIETLNFDMPDVSWMENPKKETDFISWLMEDLEE